MGRSFLVGSVLGLVVCTCIQVPILFCERKRLRFRLAIGVIVWWTIIVFPTLVVLPFLGDLAVAANQLMHGAGGLVITALKMFLCTAGPFMFLIVWRRYRGT